MFFQYFKISIYLIWRLVCCRMPCEVSFPFESSITLVPLKRRFPSVCPHVSLQGRWLSARSMIERKQSCTGDTCKAFLLYASSCGVLIQTLYCLKNRILCNYVAFHQSASFCVCSRYLIVLFCMYILIAMEGFFSKMRPPVLLQVTLLCCFVLTLITIEESFPAARYAFRYAFWGQKNVCMRSCTVCTCAVSPQCEWVRVSSNYPLN